MKHFGFILIALLLSINSIAQNIEWNYESEALNADAETPYGILHGSNYYILTNFSNADSNWTLLQKLDPSGILISNAPIQIENYTTSASKIIPIADSLVVVGILQDPLDVEQDKIHLTRFDLDLNQGTSAQISCGHDLCVITDVELSSTNEFVISLTIWDIGISFPDIVLILVSETGDLLATNHLILNNSLELSYDITTNAFGPGYLLAARTPIASNTFSSINKLLFLDDQLNVNSVFGIPSVTSPQDQRTRPYSNMTIVQLPDSSILLSGKIEPAEFEPWNYGIVRIDRQGNMLSLFSDGRTDTLDYVAYNQAMVPLNISRTALLGNGFFQNFAPHGTVPSYLDLYILDAELEIECQYEFGGDKYYSAVRIENDSADQFLIMGSNFDIDTDTHTKGFIMKVDMAGCVTVGITENSSEQKVLNIFPNPGNDEININIGQNDAPFNLKIFDVYGRIVFSQEIHQPNGAIQLPQLNNGLYLIQVLDQNQKLIGTKRWVRSSN